MDSINKIAITTEQWNEREELKKRLRKRFDRLDKIHDEYQYKIDKLKQQRDRDLEICWTLIDHDRKKLEEVGHNE